MLHLEYKTSFTSKKTDMVKSFMISQQICHLKQKLTTTIDIVKSKAHICPPTLYRRLLLLQKQGKY